MTHEELKVYCAERLDQIRKAIKILYNLGANPEERVWANKIIFAEDQSFWRMIDGFFQQRSLIGAELSPLDVVGAHDATQKPGTVIPEVPLSRTTPKKPVASATLQKRQVVNTTGPSWATGGVITMNPAEKTPNDHKRELMKYLNIFVDGGDIYPIKTRDKIALVARLGVELDRDEWVIFFEALVRADRISLNNKYYHILSKDCGPTVFFTTAPPDLLRAYIFDSLNLRLEAFFNELKEGCQIEGFLLAKTGLFLDLLWVAKQTSLLTKEECKKLEWLVPTLQKVGAPKELINNSIDILEGGRVCRKNKGVGLLGTKIQTALRGDRGTSPESSVEAGHQSYGGHRLSVQ